MTRVKFLENTQRNFLFLAKKKNKSAWSEIARICNIHPRTLHDWRRNKYKMTESALERLSKECRIGIPKKIRILPEYWGIKKAPKLGALQRNKIYGNPGTAEGRRKGGLASALKFKMDPEYAKKVGFIVRKEIIRPQKSPLLAEFIGIVLGDGTISNYQLRISVNSKTDKLYSYFIKKIAKKLFGLTTSIIEGDKNTLNVTISSKNLVDFLLNCGLKKGDKIANKADIPEWIFKNKKYMKSCLRGLIDTDGGIYFHTHLTKGIRYRNIGLCFTSNSKDLLHSVHHIFLTLGINAKNNMKNHISIYNKEEIKKYMEIIGSHNSKHIGRFKSHKTVRI